MTGGNFPRGTFPRTEKLIIRINLSQSVVLTSNIKGKLGIPVNQSILRKTLENLEMFYNSIFYIQFLNEPAQILIIITILCNFSFFTYFFPF